MTMQYNHCVIREEKVINALDDIQENANDSKEDQATVEFFEHVGMFLVNFIRAKEGKSYDLNS